MRRFILVLLGVAIVWSRACAAEASGGADLSWAYGFDTPPLSDEKRPVVTLAPYISKPQAGESLEDWMKPRRVSGSEVVFSLKEIRDRTNTHGRNWYPDDQPPMPDIVARGPVALGPRTYSCAFCHFPTGKGRPENAPITGLPVAYFLRQLDDFRRDARLPADPRKTNPVVMAALAKAMTEEEMKTAAEYFGSMKWTPWTRVIESDRVPRTLKKGALHRAIEKELTEPIAGRIIEVPEDNEQFDLANPRSGCVAYVPTGSLTQGRDLVTTGGARVVDGQIVLGKTIACATCHGPDLMGLADIPGIAGRSPSYLARQLNDLKRGTRKGVSAPLMQPVVANLTNEDIVAIVAYVASIGGR